jgi:Prenyltransferase and squalene oxidase repeat
VKESLLQFLLSNQNTDGSWGYLPGTRAALEPTAYASITLREEKAGQGASTRALEFMRSRQASDGGWPVSLADTESSAWVTALVGMALLESEGKPAACIAGERFIVRSFGKMPKAWILRVAEWMQSLDSSYVDQNYGGWSWNPETARWVEPTAYALLFLKKLDRSGSVASSQGAKNSSGIILEAESFLYQRRCKEGGWNYGNSEVLGEVLRPFPLTTALVLMALQDHSSRPEMQAGLRYLRRAASDEKSALAIAVASLCFDVYGLEKEQLFPSLVALSERTKLFRNVRTAALALMALQTREGKNPFRLESRKNVCPALLTSPGSKHASA